MNIGSGALQGQDDLLSTVCIVTMRMVDFAGALYSLCRTSNRGQRSISNCLITISHYGSNHAAHEKGAPTSPASFCVLMSMALA